MQPTYKILDHAASSTDSQALDARIASYANFAKHDVNEILDVELAHMESARPWRILDLGCGSGKQSLYLADKFPQATIHSFDVSAESIAKLNAHQNPRITACAQSYDDVEFLQNLQSESYDLILSFFSIYYAKDLPALLAKLRTSLCVNGKLLLVGFSKSNNQEINAITAMVTGKSIATEDFMAESLRAQAFPRDEVRTSVFENGLAFPNYDSLANYYRNYGLYDARVDEYLQKKFTAPFYWSKSSLVVCYTKLASLSQLPAHLHSDVYRLSDYERFLQDCQARSVRSISFAEAFQLSASHTESMLLLRHDLDLDPACALVTARLEHRYGIQATYFIMTSGYFYNAFSPEALQVIEDLVKFGHHIGIHYDGPMGKSLELLAAAVGAPITIASQHNPTLLGRSLPELGLHDAYDPKLFEEQNFHYISDSGKSWRTETLADAPKHQRLYLLTHPESWVYGNLDMAQMIRAIENKTLHNVRAHYAEFARGNVEYLEARMASLPQEQ